MKRIGTQKALGEEKRNDLLLALAWWRERSRQFYSSRTKAEEAFYCVWDGQHADGTVHDSKDDLAWPFDGASDQRVRWGEKVVLDKIALVMIALSSCEVEFACGAGPDAEKRANALKNILIPRFEEEVKFIADALDEKEREEFARLKVIKQMKNSGSE